MTPATSKPISALAQFDTPTICDVIELFHVRPRNRGFLGPQIRAHFPELPPMVGFAVTSTYRSAAPPANGDHAGSIEKQIELFAGLPGPAVIVIQDLDEPSAAASFGGNMCAMYRAFGAVGLISAGFGRDLEEVHSLRFPVFSHGAFCSHGYGHFLTVGASISVGGTTVAFADLLHGDANGVTTIPLEIADELPEVAAEFQVAEKKVAEFLRSPVAKTLAQCQEVRQEFFTFANRLAARVRRDQTSSAANR